MKKVWILEKFEGHEEMVKSLNIIEEAFKTNGDKLDADGVKSVEESIAAYKKRIEENPNGWWIGWEGKTIYRQFCDCARDALRRADKSWKFRVVEGEIEDNAWSWLGYKFVKENEGVLRYLMATK